MAEIYQRGLDIAGESAMDFGPAHIVWADENFEDDNIQWCIDNAHKNRRDLSNLELDAVMQSLEELLLVPTEIRCCEPADYDGKHPEKYPPRPDLVMVPK